MVALGEGMDIEPVACSHVGERRGAQSFRAHKIVVGCQFHVITLAREHADAMAGPFGQGGIVGKIIAPRGRGFAVRRHDKIEGESLRRLHHAKVAAVERLDHDRAIVQFFYRVGDRNRRHCRTALFAGSDGARDQRAGDEWACGVVNEHELRRARR